MKISNKQLEEIQFMEEFGKCSSTIEQREQYINATVNGIGNASIDQFGRQNNPLLIAKRSLEISMGAWREDLANGMLSIQELKEDFGNSNFGKNLLKSLSKGIKPNYEKSLECLDIYKRSNDSEHKEKMKNLSFGLAGVIIDNINYGSH